ncbi:MAG: hypothetical protein GC187_08810 [Alphaproteobacteria bacterium]|nr:hypothetical protein [Alphaproteobacteria bacterium]
MGETVIQPAARPDYSWARLAGLPVPELSGGIRTLQDYWRQDPATGRLRSDEELRGLGLLTEQEGKHWHALHAPAAGSSNPMPEALAKEIRLRLAQSQEPGHGPVLLDGAVLRSALRLDTGGDADAGRPCGVSLADAQFEAGADFSHWRFGAGTSFARAQFLAGADFSHAQFHAHADFSKARFFGAAMFGDARFGAGASFHSVRFEGWTFFEKAIFEDGQANFNEALFHEYGRFKEAQFHGLAQFSYATFFKKADFHLAQFHGPACFDGVEFFGVSAFLEATFARRFSFTDALHQALCEFSKLKVTSVHESDWRSAFKGARVEALFNLAGGPYHIISAFDGAILSGWMRYPVVGERNDLNEFRKKALRPARSAPGKERTAALSALEGGARVLKHAMARQADSLREQQFYRFEVETRRRNKVTPPGEKLVSWLYSGTAEYGLSVLRPVGWLAGVIVGFAAAYWAAITCLKLTPDLWTQALWAGQLSLQSIVTPLFVWDPDGIAASPPLRAFEQAEALFWLQLASSAQSFVSLILIFLFALSIRRRFQIS